jgi:hypothetical protein
MTVQGSACHDDRVLAVELLPEEETLSMLASGT